MVEEGAEGTAVDLQRPAETVAEKPMFRSAFRSRRWVVPASGFYEWTGPKTARQPWYISASAGGVLSFAGLWERYRDPETGEDRMSATIVVCEANNFMAKLHDRMPVILDGSGIEAWLTGADNELLKPAPDDVLQAWPVSPAVNSNRYHEPDTVMAITAGEP